jgi:D-erythronate 2-dehydrogenase
MHILIIGAAGMVGRKLTERLVADGRLGDREVSALTLADVIDPPKPAGFKGAGFRGEVRTVAVDISKPGEMEKLIATRPDTVVHLAAIVSGGKRKPISTRAMPSIWTAPVSCSMRSGWKA